MSPLTPARKWALQWKEQGSSSASLFSSTCLRGCDSCTLPRGPVRPPSLLHSQGHWSSWLSVSPTLPSDAKHSFISGGYKLRYMTTAAHTRMNTCVQKVWPASKITLFPPTSYQTAPPEDILSWCPVGLDFPRDISTPDSFQNCFGITFSANRKFYMDLLADL